MNNPSKKLNKKFCESLQNIARQGFQNAAAGLSGMTGVTMNVYEPCVNLVPVKDIPYALGGPENDAVGIYIKVEGELSGHVLLIMPYQKAFEIVDLLMNEPPGTTKKLGSVERSALAEVGNLTGSFFLNALSDHTGLPSRPSPPVVMVDMVGAILDIITAVVGTMGDEVLMFQATFTIHEQDMCTDLWVIPDAATLDKLTGEIAENHA